MRLNENRRKVGLASARFIPVAEALSRVVPDSNRRVILSIRQGQEPLHSSSSPGQCVFPPEPYVDLADFRSGATAQHNPSAPQGFFIIPNALVQFLDAGHFAIE